ncbi:secretin N-terminal domain-containing protein [Methyloraptor flagellatus]|uniref:Secretin N-terminal domain-containing protein n=1 Tax=Methyloraptor flagellatus TaxID=3162530 RepID=A0AAU7X6A4_9HYPH
MSLVAATALAGALALGACSSTMQGDACSDIGNMSPEMRSQRNCGTGPTSQSGLRNATYEGTDSPLLWSGKGPAENGFLQTGSINQPVPTPGGRPFVGYVGTLRVDYAPDPKKTADDVKDLRVLRGERFDPNETTSLKFDKVDLAVFLKQTLGGILSVNYTVPEDLAGKVSFYTEQPIPKADVLHLVRDILARNGYQMVLLDGVYHIGKPDTITSMVQMRTAGRSGEQSTRLVKISKGNSTEIAAFVRQIVGPDVSIGPANGGDSVVVSAPTAQMDQVASLVQSLADGGIGEDRIAIVPIQRSSPGRIAEELSQFYRERFSGSPSKQDGISLTALTSQKAILVATRDPRLMAGARRMIDELDRAAGEESSLRVVQLVNAKAEDAVDRLKVVFGGEAAQGPADTPRRDQTGGKDEGDAETAPADGNRNTSRNRNNNSQNNSGQNNGGQGDTSAATAKERFAAAARLAAKGMDSVNTGSIPSGLRFSSDPRNNAVLIYSDYSSFLKIRDFLKTIDVADAQVVIEATIAEVSITDDLQYGVQAYLRAHGIAVGSGTSTPNIATPPSGGFLAGSGTTGQLTWGAVLNALQGVTTVKVISSPYLTVVNGKTARLVVGDQIPFANRTVNSNSSGQTTVTQEVETKDTGIVLEVTPRIQANNVVSLNVDQQVSKAQDNVLSGNLTPVISNRQVKSEITVMSGNTVLLGGLLQDRIDKTDNGVPGLSKLPVVGDLFSQRTDKTTRVELVIMITPRVVRSNTEIDTVTRVIRSQSRIR